MIAIFRKIRQKLLQENRITRYFAYAIGEIVLVVIGILIALSINTWNENLKNKNKEKLILKDLHLEFQKNKEKLQATIKLHRNVLNGTNAALELISEPEDVLARHNLDSLIAISLDYGDFSPSQSVLADLISSGNLNLISSESLRLLIFDWGSAIEEKEESYETMDETSQNLFLPYLTKNTSMKNIDQYSLSKGTGKSRLNPQVHKLFQELEFENHLENQAWGIINYLTKLERLEALADQIIFLSDPDFEPKP